LKIGGLSCFPCPAYPSLPLDGARGTTTRTAMTTRRETSHANDAIAMTARQGALKDGSNGNIGQTSYAQGNMNLQIRNEIVEKVKIACRPGQ
jgi:hypothetical protein